jgi:quinol monooxygenase YgiN
MSDLNVVAVLKAKAGSESVLQEALTSLVEPTRAEPGCISYELYRSEVDATTFITIELWRSQADLDAHMETPHIAQALTAAADAFDGAPAIHPLAPVSR